MDKINTLLEKYDNFKWAQMRSIQQLEDSSKILTLVVQDDDGEDIQTIKIEFNQHSIEIYLSLPSIMKFGICQ